MNNNKSEKFSFMELISKYAIEIPIIQRDYAQGRQGKEELRKTFLNSLMDALQGKKLELDFIYGSVENNILQPLDGQQRLTTLFLLHWYLANKEQQMDDVLKELLSKFTYETRATSREFILDLVQKGIDFQNFSLPDVDNNGKSMQNALSKTIINSSWFFLAWRRDPTIKAMLTMLDAVHQKFNKSENLWSNIKNITFHFIKLENFGLTDDLYIKMNARGKALTEFENFKAQFENHIEKEIYKEDEGGKKLLIKENWEKDIEEPTKKFAHKVDTDWADFFWNYRDEKNLYDNQFLNFFRTNALLHYALKNKGTTDDFRKNIDDFRNTKKALYFNQYLELDAIDKAYFANIYSILNQIFVKKSKNDLIFENEYFDENILFEGAIKNDLGYANLLKFYAFYQYVALEETIDDNKFYEWLRINRNLIEAHSYYFDNANTFTDSLVFISNLLEHRNNILPYFRDSLNAETKGFPKFILEEEKLKAKLILQHDDWKEAILKAENHRYFNGQIEFLLDWCKDENGVPNIEKFKHYDKKTNSIFEADGLRKFDEHLFERALLTKGDYLLKKNSNKSFLIDNERDISWKRLLRDKNEERLVLKRLLDDIDENTSIEQNLLQFVEDFEDENDWRYYFIKQPEMINACGSRKFIRYYGEYNILLLETTATNGYHREYYSYSLYQKIKENIDKEISYIKQKSVDDWKYFTIENKQLAFYWKEEKYVWTTDNDWENCQSFEDREKAVVALGSFE